MITTGRPVSRRVVPCMPPELSYCSTCSRTQARVLGPYSPSTAMALINTSGRYPRHDPCSILIAQVRQYPVVVGELRLIGREDSESLATDRVADAAAPRPGRQHVIEAPVGVQRDRGERVLVAPGVAGRSVARDLPGVIEDQAGHDRRSLSGAPAQLAAAGPAVEAPAHDDRVAAVRPLLDDPGQLADLRLPHRAGVQRVVQHHHQELDLAAIARPD